MQNRIILHEIRDGIYLMFRHINKKQKIALKKQPNTKMFAPSQVSHGTNKTLQSTNRASLRSIKPPLNPSQKQLGI
jgi:hypothetical protein